MQSPEHKKRKRRRSARLFGWFVAAAAVACVAFISAAVYLITRPTELKIAVASSRGEDLAFLQGVGRVFAASREAVRLSVTPVSDERAITGVIGGQHAELAVMRADSGIPANLRAVAILRKEYILLWTVRKGTKSDAALPIEQLSGRRIGLLGSDADVELVKLVLREAGVDVGRTTVTGYTAAEDMARDTANDVIGVVGALNDRFVQDSWAATLRLRGEPHFIAIEGSEAIAKRHPYLEAVEVPARIFSPSPPRPPENLETVSVDRLIVAAKKVPEASIVSLSRQLFESRPTLLASLPGLASLEKPNTDKDAPIPAHPGAAAYIDGSDRTFLERYSDLIWAAVLLLSGIGSSGAWLRSYLKREERDEYLKARDQVLVLVSAVREAENVAALADLQRQADEILENTLEFFDDGAIGKASLQAFGLVLEQFHHAISDRREVLLGAPKPDNAEHV